VFDHGRNGRVIPSNGEEFRVRSGMGPATWHGGVSRDKDEIDHRRFRIWAPFSLDRYTGFFNTHEDEQGKPLDFEGSLSMPDGKQVGLTAVRHRLQHAPGTKNVIGGTFELCDEEGRWREYHLRAAGTPADVQGLGYYGGWRDGGSAGIYRGVGPIIETDRYPYLTVGARYPVVSFGCPIARTSAPTSI
jgi:hypothetical protein